MAGTPGLVLRQTDLAATPAVVVATLNSAQKFGVVVETAVRNEVELSEYCRSCRLQLAQ